MPRVVQMQRLLAIKFLPSFDPFDLLPIVQAQGKLEAFLAKKRQKNAAKEHTKIPLKRRSASTS